MHYMLKFFLLIEFLMNSICVDERNFCTPNLYLFYEKDHRKILSEYLFCDVFNALSWLYWLQPLLFNIAKKHSDILSLKIGEKGYINLKFEAISPACIDAALNIIVINNCFDVWKVFTWKLKSAYTINMIYSFQLYLNTFAFDALVCLEELPVILLKNKKIAYFLEFGPVNRGELYKIRFKIRNISDSVFKFKFEQMPELIFSPSAGHLYEGSEKSIIAAFRTTRHISFRKVGV